MIGEARYLDRASIATGFGLLADELTRRHRSAPCIGLAAAP